MQFKKRLQMIRTTSGFTMIERKSVIPILNSQFKRLLDPPPFEMSPNLLVQAKSVKLYHLISLSISDIRIRD